MSTTTGLVALVTVVGAADMFVDGLLGVGRRFGVAPFAASASMCTRALRQTPTRHSRRTRLSSWEWWAEVGEAEHCERAQPSGCGNRRRGE